MHGHICHKIVFVSKIPPNFHLNKQVLIPEPQNPRTGVQPFITNQCTNFYEDLPSRLVSSAQERYHVSLFFSLASRSYFSSVLFSTMPVRYMIWPPIVDLPASNKLRGKYYSTWVKLFAFLVNTESYIIILSIASEINPFQLHILHTINYKSPNNNEQKYESLKSYKK